jgi:L-lysine 6-transaminase
MLADGFGFVADLDKSHGMIIHDSVTNQEFLDFFSYFASWPLGHNHPKMLDSVFVSCMGMLATQNPSNSDIYTVEMAQFVATFERVCMPPEFTHVFFVAGGTLAVENAMKAAFDWKVRKNLARGKGEKGSKVIYFKNAFHGRSGYTLTVTNTHDPNKTKFYPKFDWYRVENPYARFPLAEAENLRLTVEAEERAVKQILEILEKDQDDIASIVIEPIQGEGGDNHFRPEFMQQLRKIATEHEIMLIFDEVQCGMGLTGTVWAWQQLGIVPDMCCFGKKSQICGFMSTARIDEVPDNVFVVSSRINSTWGGNLCDMTRSMRFMEVMEDEKLLENTTKVGAYLLHQLEKIAARYPKLVSGVRGRGLMCAFNLPDGAIRREIVNGAAAKRLLVLPSGSRSIRFRPALIAQPADVDQAIAILDEVLKVM